MKKLLFALLAALLLLPSTAMADDLSATLSGDGQGLAVLVTDGGQIAFTILTNGIGTPTGAQILRGTAVFLDLGADFSNSSATGSVNASGAQIADLNDNTDSFTLAVEGPGGLLTGPLRSAGPPDTGGGGDGGDDGGGDDGGGDDGGGDGGSQPSTACTPVANQGTAPCVPGDKTLCLNEGRFEVTTDWTATTQGTSGEGDAIALEGIGDTGLFYFFNPQNIEVVVKILDACSFADRFWIFAGGLTNVEVDLTVRDTETGETRLCENPPLTAFQPIQDTDAFATCP